LAASLREAGENTMSEENKPSRKIQDSLPSVEDVQRELGKAKSMDDFFGKEGIFARLFAHTIEEMLEAELSEHLGYEPYEVKGRNSGNSRNGRYAKKLRTSNGETTIQVPRDRNAEFEPQVVRKQVANTNELEDKIIGMYAKGMSVRDIQETLEELYGVTVSPTTLSAITDKVWGLVEEWQNRSLASIYPIIYLDAIHIKLRREAKVHNTAVYTVLGVDVEGHRDVLGHWVGEGSEKRQFLAECHHRSAKSRRYRYFHRLHGWLEWVQGSRPGGLSQNPNSTLCHPSNPQQLEVYRLEGSPGLHERSEADLSGTHPREC
jgi:transposase-like protein